MSESTSGTHDRILRHARGYLELGELLADGEGPPVAAARTMLRRCLEEIARLPEGVRDRSVVRLVEGEALRALGDYSAALTPLASAAATQPRHVEAWLGLGWCLKRLGRLEAAITALRRGLEAVPEEAILLYNLSCYHALAGDVPAAIDHLSRAIALDDRFRDLTGSEPDFDAIRTDPRFVAATCVIA